MDVALLVHQEKNGTPTTNELINGVRVVKVKRQGVLLYAPLCFSFLTELKKLIKSFRPDIIHIHMPNLSAFYCLLLSEAKALPWVVHWHSDVLGQVPDWRISIAYRGYAVLEHYLLKKSNCIIATSPVYFDNSRVLQRHREKCITIPLGIRSLAPLPTAPKSKKGQLRLLVIGRLAYYKGHKYLIEAVNNVEQAQLRIVGDGELRDDLQLTTAQLELNERVEFLGRLTDLQLRHEIQNCDLLCLPSIEKTEAFGVVLLEAARQGKPCLVTDVKGSGMSWVVRHNETGVVVPSGNSAALALALQSLQNDPEKLRQMGEAAQIRFNNLFLIDNVSTQVVSLYKSMLS